SINAAEARKFIALSLEDHLFIGADNGLFSLISDKNPAEIVTLPFRSSSFPSRDILADAAAQAASGKPLSELGETADDYHRMIGRHLRATRKQISGHVIRVDHYGNLITNIEQAVFNTLNKDNDFTIIVGRERLN